MNSSISPISKILIETLITGNQVKARSVLERARLKNPASPELWKRAIELEKRVSGNEIADRLLSRAMQECAASGSLWAEAIECASRPARKVNSTSVFPCF